MYHETKRDLEKKVFLGEFKNSNKPLHFHKSIELLYVISGEFDFRVGEKTARIKSGEIVFVPSYLAHSLDYVGETLSYTLMIPENYFNNQFNSSFNYFLLYNQTVNAEIFKLMQKIKDEFTNDSLYLQGLIYEILGLIVKHYQPITLDFNINSFAIQIINYIRDNFDKRITLEEVSKHFGYSKYYFSRRFHQIFGCNLKTYINRVRFDNVMDMKEDINMTEKILASGFSNLSTYYKMKKKL